MTRLRGCTGWRGGGRQRSPSPLDYDLGRPTGEGVSGGPGADATPDATLIGDAATKSSGRRIRLVLLVALLRLLLLLLGALLLDRLLRLLLRFRLGVLALTHLGHSFGRVARGDGRVTDGPLVGFESTTTLQPRASHPWSSRRAGERGRIAELGRGAAAARAVRPPGGLFFRRPELG